MIFSLCATETQKCSSAAAENLHGTKTIEVETVGDCISGQMQMLGKGSLTNAFEANEEAPIEKRGADVSCSHGAINNEADPLEKDQSGGADLSCSHGANSNEADPMEKDGTSIPHNCDRRPSFMEKNTTARVYEVIVFFNYNLFSW